MPNHSPLNRRRVILAGSALAASAALSTAPRRPGSRPPPICSPPRAGCSAAWTGPAQGRVVCVGRSRMARLELFRRGGLHQAGPAARADECRAEGGCLGSARGVVLAGGPRKDPQRDAAAGRSCGKRQWRGPAFLAAVFLCDLRHAGGDRRMGFPARRPPSHAIDQRARRADRFGHAIVVLGAAPRITTGKHAGLITLKDEEALARRLAADLAEKPRVKQSDSPLYNIMSWAGRERANAGRSAFRPRNSPPRSVTCCGRSSIPIRWSI